MMSSSYYKSKITEIENIRTQVKGVLGNFDSCDAVLVKSQKYIDEITINGETIDQGKLLEVSNTFKDAESDLNTIITECNQKLEEYNSLYRQALASEEAARERERQRRAAAARSTSSSSNMRI
jgi:hypothetical protein